MSETLFLCRACYPNPPASAVGYGAIPRGECSRCGAICSDMPASGLPPGSLVAAESAPAPRALTRQEWEAQVREAPPAPEPLKPNPFFATDDQERCSEAAACGGLCCKARGHGGSHACSPDPDTGKETCPAGDAGEDDDEPLPLSPVEQAFRAVVESPELAIEPPVIEADPPTRPDPVKPPKRRKGNK